MTDTTNTAFADEKPPRRPPLPPIEGGQAVAPGMAPPDFASHAAHWIHQHPHATESGLGYAVYQGLRGLAAAVPYGISMACTLGAMEGLARGGNALKTAHAADSFLHQCGKRLHQFASFGAIRSGAVISTSFLLYRGTSKLGKWTNAHLFDPNDTEAQTAENIRTYPQALWEKIKENAPAGIASTPVAAFALGFINSNFNPAAKPMVNEAGHSLAWRRENYLQAVKEGRGGKLLREVITHPNAGFIEQMAINTLGYSVFFEIGDRLFKDTQIRRGLWKGEHHSIVNQLPDSAVAPDPTQPVPEKKYGFFTDEPSLGRFLFRRMLPTVASIGAYTAFKFRHSYMLLGNFELAKDKAILPQIPKLIGIEGTAVTLFAIIPFIGDKWEKAYDDFFAKKEAEAHPAPSQSTPDFTVTHPSLQGRSIATENAAPAR